MSKVDLWQTGEGEIGHQPNVPPNEGYIPAGPWEPMGVSTSGDNGEIQSWLVWKRPLVKDPHAIPSPQNLA